MTLMVTNRPSLRARGYYYAVVLPAIARQMGDEDFRRVHNIILEDLSKDAVHDWLKSQLLPGGDDPYLPGFARRTADGHISVEDYSDFMFRVVVWGHLRGIDVPPPRTEQS